MALQSLLHDPNIASFLDQIPLNQRIITLKQLIYIGIKIVNNQFTHQQSTPNQTQSHFANKENFQKNTIHQKPQQNSNKKGRKQKILKQKSNPNFNNHLKSQKVESTLLREISKIRVQLENLTNKVYDHYFEEENQQSQSQNEHLMSFNKKDRNDQAVSYGFANCEDIPTFSPERNLNVSKSKHQINPFLKQKGEIQYQPKKKSLQRHQNIQTLNNDSRARAKSNIQHLDDTQVRQALYRQDESQFQSSQQKVRTKKSQSVIERRHQEKKKDQQNFFYQLDVEKQRLNELKRFQECKSAAVESSYKQFTEKLPPRVDHIKKKVKSKIKKDVERDRLRYQNKMQEENFKKGFEQYEYSANQQVEEEDQYEEEVEGDQDQQVQDEFEDNANDEQEESSKSLQMQQNLQPKQSRSPQYMNSPQEEYDRQRDVSQPNFGFYDSRGKSSSSQAKEKASFNSQNMKNDRIINAANDESSFSEFSEFSMSSSNSRRENGKISRRRNE